MNFKKFSLIVFMALIGFSAMAQINVGGKPLSFTYTHELPADIPAMVMPEVDADALIAEDALNKGKEIPYRFGFNHFGFYTPDNCGVWKTLKHGERVWRLAIKCPNAYSINIAFAKFNIPEGAKLYVYNKSRNYVLGGFTNKNMMPDGQFGVDVVPGDEIVVEYNEPANAAFHGDLNIFRITHAYRDIFKIAKDMGRGSGNCHNNVICPVGDPWRDEISSVAMIVVNGGGICTGALINNANEDATPYFLTARHCTQGANVSTWVFRFNYQSTQCNNDVGAPTNQSISGATTRAQASAPDFSLLQLSSTPPASYNVCYAGWSRSNVPPTGGACVHHPSGDVKKISFSTAAFDSSDWDGSGPDDHWFVQWSSGVTEGGSSGSPMFDQNHRIVGQLHGGASFCGASQGSLNDEYGKLFYSWDKMGNNANQRLQNWLDPNNTGLMFIDTYCPNQVVLPDYDATAEGLLLPANGACHTDYTPGLIVTNAGDQTITSLQISWILDAGAPVVTTINGLNIVTNATDTVYLPQITYSAGSHTYSATITAVNGNADANASDNQSSGNFTSSSGNTYTLIYTTDEYGDETAFVIKDGNGTVVFEIAEGSLGANESDTLTFCLPDGCYTFTVTDAYGDGMCCTYGDGNFTLTDANNFVVASGGSFGSEQNFPFCTTILTVDAMMDAIIVPDDDHCKATVEPLVVIRNQGSQPLTQATITYQLNNNFPQTYDWTGNLAYNEIAFVTLQQFSSTATGDNFTAYITVANDANHNNDTLETTFDYIVANQLTLNLTTDDYPGETFWFVTDPTGNNTYYSGPLAAYAYQANTTYKIEMCLPDGCYKFYIVDDAEDGICCASGDGQYTLLAQTGTIGNGGEFDAVDSLEFCLPLVGIDEDAVANIKVFPNPANGNIYLAFGETVNEALTVELINTLGQVVKTTTVQHTAMANVNIAGLPAGLYMVRVYGQKTKPFTTSVIIKH